MHAWKMGCSNDDGDDGRDGDGGDDNDNEECIASLWIFLYHISDNNECLFVTRSSSKCSWQNKQFSR